MDSKTNPENPHSSPIVVPNELQRKESAEDQIGSECIVVAQVGALAHLFISCIYSNRYSIILVGSSAFHQLLVTKSMGNSCDDLGSSEYTF